MKSKNTIFQLIEKLKDIDVNAVIEKSKNITLEDLKSLSWKDIKSSKFTKPITGISLSIIFLFIFLLPELKKYSKNSIQSQEYSLKSRNLDNLDMTLKNSELIKSILDANLKEFTELTADKSKIINLTDLISEAAKRSLVEISEFSPINKDALASCAASANNSDDDFNNADFDLQDDFNEFPDDQFSDDQFSDDPFMYDDGSKIDALEELNKKIEYVNNNKNFLLSLIPDINKSEIPKNIDEKFESNYFRIEFLGDYINVLNFLRSIQEYKILILPKCFEPSLLTQSANQMPSQNNNQPGFVRARLLINVPTKE